ncbi:hypothetical protein FZC79_04400 [Rossellomorea vietnamensis]|uniref:GH26 domain-containing protein n=1 Tax=Rossellomorea vietnamensis TaxID=218284 RepID=A0A5D4KKW0_9BACI|nr:stalk domain-containing protein [Rossellomorea vietnamensis]TYR76943.1 hypothetical protein FZC79_04400 [Rossellomorea vietnamensis]
MKKIYLTVITALLFCFFIGTQEIEANSWIDYTKGIELLEKGKPADAIPYLKRAATEANNASYYRALADAYEANNQFQKAADTLYTEAAIHYKIGLKNGDLNTYHAVKNKADKLNSELELYSLEHAKTVGTKPLAKYEPESGMYIGAFINGDEPLKEFGNLKYSEFNRITSKNHATYFRYWNYGDSFPTEWAESVKDTGAALHIALEPNNGLGPVKDDAYLRKFARDAAATNTPIFLRFAGEMNGNWVEWNGNPSEYIKSFRTVSQVMAEEAYNVAMVWSPSANPKRTINEYYPGDDYVDWVGASIYSVMFFNGDVSKSAEHVNPLDSLDDLYTEYADRKPIMISEYGATTYSKAGDMDTTDFAINKMKMLYHGAMLKYPRVKSIQWFSLNTLISSHSADRMLNNYSLTDNQKLLDEYSALIGDEYYLEDVVNGPFATTKHTELPSIVTLENEVIRKPTTIYAWAKTYDPNISKVLFKLNGKHVSQSNSFPYSIEINPNQLQSGKHQLQTFVYDSQGRKAIEKSVVFQTGEEPSPSNSESILYINEPKAYTKNGAVRLLTAPQILNGRTLVPLRFISEQMGAKVKWNSQNKSITIESEEQTIVLVINQTYAKINGKQIKLDTTPIVINGTTMVPIRFISEQLQTGISYENATKKVTITP